MTEPDTPRRSFWQVARTPRMVGLLVLFLAAAAVCGWLGMWQIDRAHERGQLAEKQAEAERLDQETAGLGTLLPPQQGFPGDLVGRKTWVEGTYEPDGQLLVVDRVLDGVAGYLVLSPLRVSDDGTGGASWADLSGPPVVPVVRGWVPDTAALDDAALVPPSGTVRVTGYLQVGEATDQGGLPAGQTDAISTAALANQWGPPIYSGYVVLAESDPAQPDAAAGGPALLPRPTLSGSEGLNLQNAFYAIEWFVFGGFALLLWVRLVRDEASGRKGISELDPDAIDPEGVDA
ncbi:SURF1-like protein [Sediminihabitans luteus]|uniref:SURF1 family protein n=1 Tax=Sediminihabitans luteus TaxID=1138585 RepID=UPI001A56E0B6|nr:SURF1 family protein [Sediminihabitans luteus]GII98639.1 SURF1-like protein [Sediminihabitans luteus]